MVNRKTHRETTVGCGYSEGMTVTIINHATTVVCTITLIHPHSDLLRSLAPRDLSSSLWLSLVFALGNGQPIDSEKGSPFDLCPHSNNHPRITLRSSSWVGSSVLLYRFSVVSHRISASTFRSPTQSRESKPELDARKTSQHSHLVTNTCAITISVSLFLQKYSFIRQAQREPIRRTTHWKDLSATRHN